MGGARRRARGRAARPRRARLRPPPPRVGPPLPAAPALRARGEADEREGGHRARRLGPAVRGADVGDRGRRCPDEDEPVALEVALSRLSSPDRDVRAHRRRGGHRGAAPGPAHPRLHLQHAARRQGARRPPARLPHLAERAQPLQRGVRRVRRGARRAPCATATRSPAAGTASRRSCSASTGSPTTTAWPPCPTSRRPSSGRTPATIVQDCFAGFAASSATSSAASSTSPGSTRPSARASAAAPSAPTRRPPRTRTCCSTTRPSAATCSRSPTSSATACTRRSAPRRACSTCRRR